LNCKHYILFLVSFLIEIASFGQNIEFIENKGQWDDRVRFMGQVSNGAFFIHNNGFTVLQHDGKDWETLHQATHDHMVNGKLFQGQPIVVHSHAYRVSFVGANSKSQVETDKPLFTYNNYFIGNDPSKWGADCKLYQAITIKDVYPDIDVRYYSDKGTLKYDIIVRPGGDVSKIALKYEGADALAIKNKELIISTSVGDLKELSPYTYQYSEKGKMAVNTRYSLKDNIVRFDVRKYDPSATLIIDPSLIFCSFTGSSADNWGFSATYGPDGSMFGGGIVFSAGFPVSTGAFQTTSGGGSGGFADGFDIGIIKLTPDGSNRVYATYVGGSGNEFPQSLIVDQQGELIIGGRTNSSNYPLAGGGAIGSQGGYDIIVTKLNAAGSALIGSRKIGGTGDDGSNISPYGGSTAVSLQRNYGDEARSEVNLDAAGNIYLASCTQSTNFPIVGGFQNVNGGGTNNQDGVVLKFNPDLSSLLFSTYLGGNGNDAAYVLSVNSTGDIYVAGGTESTDLPGPTGGSIGASNHGSIDGFVSIIANNGASVIKTTYLGTPAIDQVYGIQFDLLGFPYVMGQTTGAWPIQNAAWSQPNGRQFIAKLQPDLSSFVYSTTFGKGDAAPDISPVAFLVDRCENVYISGWGGRAVQGLNYPTAGVAGLPVTPDAIKSTPDVLQPNGLGEDFYFFVLKRNATSQLYGSFFGQNGGGIGDHVDGGTSRFDKNGIIYQAICASCGNTGSFPTTPGAWATSKPGAANCNLALVKIDFDLSGVRSGIQSWINGKPRDTAGCVPLTVEFRDTVQNAVRYEWNFGDGSLPAIVSTTQPVITHQFTAVGTYRVMLVAIDSTTCNMRDTSYVNIKVSDLRSQLDFVPVKLNPCDSFKYRFDNNSIAPAARPFGANVFKWDFGDGSPVVTAGAGSVFHNYAAPGTYNVKLILTDSVYCNYPDTVIIQLRVAALVKAGFTVSEGCAPYNAQFTNTSQAGAQFIWDFGDGGGSSAVDPVHLYQDPGTYTIRLIAIDSATCNIADTTQLSITIFGKPTADFSAAVQPPVTNAPIFFTNLSSADAIRFKWLFGDGDTLVTNSRNVIQHEYNTTATFNACLVASNVAGCPDTVCRQVKTLIEPAVDVPTAFTPGKEGPNSIVYVRGFGIAKMKFTVWARWGEKVFETDTKQSGWNGYFKGKLLPMDVYAYTLEVEFSDGTRTTKKGDITLIR
jgi:gliding motility-associated-like protein